MSSRSQPRRRIVGTSLKMYFDLPATLSYAKRLATLSALASQNNIDLFIIPDFISLLPTKDILKDTSILLGAQDTFSAASGAFTGEVSPLNLSQAGVQIVEIGHAERRRLFHETDAQVAEKAAAVINHGMTPLVCIGEKSPPGPIISQAVGIAVAECEVQLRAVLKAIPADKDLLIAYEPVWAIGAKEPAAKDHVVAVATEIGRIVDQSRGATGPSCRVLYGGSAGPGTFEGLKDGVDGLFLGRFAHDIGNLEKVIKEMGQ